MTTTDNGRRLDPELVAEVRGMAKSGQLPSPTALKKTLRIGWDTAVEVRAAASRSIAEERADRGREFRKAMNRLAGRRRSGRPSVAGRHPSWTRFDPSAPTGPARPVEANLNVDAGRNEDGPVGPVVTRLGMVFDHAAPIGPMPAQAAPRQRPKSWPLVLIALSAFAAVWAGWVGLGGLTGFGVVQPFPGIPGLDGWRVNMAITLPVGVETYGAYALYVWLSGRAVSKLARRFAMWSAFGSLTLGAAGQITYHLLVSDGRWLITTAVSCLPVLVLGLAAALFHLIHAEEAS